MRDIKFRAWDKDARKMFIVRELHFYKTGELDEIVVDYTDYGEKIIKMADNVVLREFTGLKDKNGKEIYEGDIFNFHPSKEWKGTEPENPCVVFWSNDLAAWMFYVGKPEMSTLLPPPKSIEIIGNIYENPELLNEGKATADNSP